VGRISGVRLRNRQRNRQRKPIEDGPMTTDEKAIRDLVAEWHRATAAGDVDAVLRLMDEEVVFLVAGQPPMKGRAVFEKGLRGLLSTHRLESTHEVQEVGVSADLAYCWAMLTVRVFPLTGGAPVERSGSALSVLRKQSGAWVVVRDANLLAVT
jgi:uncharacterized protein (TIGR02246 family)